MTTSVVIGTHGQVGQALKRALAAHGHTVLCTSRRFSELGEAQGEYYLDLQNQASVRQFFQKVAARFPGQKMDVYLTGALTHVDRCEQEPKLAMAMNAEGPMLVADECRRLGYKLAFYSTEYVFGGAEYEGGRVGPFAEEDSVHPTSVYGKTKITVEKKLTALAKEFPDFRPLILRTTMVFSYEPQGMNFVMQVWRQLEAVRRGEMKEPMRVPEDQISTPTYAPALAEASIALMEQGEGGIFHLVGADLLSRREFVGRVAETFGFKPEETAKAFRFVKTAELGQAAKRPLTAGLSTDKARAKGLKIWGLDEALEDLGRLRAQDQG